MLFIQIPLRKDSETLQDLPIFFLFINKYIIYQYINTIQEIQNTSKLNLSKNKLEQTHA